MDGVGGTVKNVLFRAVFSRKTVIQTPRDVANYTNENIKDIGCIYIPHKDIPETKEIESTRYVKEMSALQVHMVKSQKIKVFYL